MTAPPACSALRAIQVNVRFESAAGSTHAVRNVDLNIARGEIVAIVGESGSGKTTLARALMGIRPPTANTSGSVELADLDLMAQTQSRLAKSVWGRKIGFIPQQPLSSLNPVLTVGQQLTEHTRAHRGIRRSAAEVLAIDALESVGVDRPEQRLKQYPHELSGGLRQRVAIAAALIGGPDVLIADEPTTALDATVQAQIVDLIVGLCRSRAMALVFISHDLQLVGVQADTVAVMYAGRLVEIATAADLASGPAMPYTRALMECSPRLDSPSGVKLRAIGGSPPDLRVIEPGCSFAPRCSRVTPECLKSRPLLAPVAGRAEQHLVACWSPQLDPVAKAPVAAHRRDTNGPHRKKLLTLRDVGVEYRLSRTRSFCALADVSLTVRQAEIVGLVGESGSGKSTLGRAVVGLQPLAAGSIEFAGSIFTPNTAAVPRRQIQLIFQDAKSSLHPRRRVYELVEEPLLIARSGSAKERRARSTELLERVGVDPARFGELTSAQLSGGQAQRVAIARALAAKPELLVCDEPVSALDVSIQSQILNLLLDLRNDSGMSILFIAHDLATVKVVCDRVIVLYRGQVCESGLAEQVLSEPSHPYTRELLEASPGFAGQRTVATGSAPSKVTSDSCVFIDRCPVAVPICAEHSPRLVGTADGRDVACHLTHSTRRGPAVGPALE